MTAKLDFPVPRIPTRTMDAAGVKFRRVWSGLASARIGEARLDCTSLSEAGWCESPWKSGCSLERRDEGRDDGREEGNENDCALGDQCSELRAALFLRGKSSASCSLRFGGRTMVDILRSYAV